jgi:MCP family monocarboxylic acid transporter-like MFS transporter 10
MTVLSGLLCLFLWLLSHSLLVLVLFAGLYGFATSSVTSLPASVIGQITPEDSLGARIGAFFSVIALASLVGSPIGGALITDPDQKEGYRWLMLFSVSIGLHVNITALIRAREHHCLSAPFSCSVVDCCIRQACERNGELPLWTSPQSPSILDVDIYGAF